MEDCTGSSFVYHTLKWLLPCASGWDVLNDALASTMRLPYKGNEILKVTNVLRMEEAWKHFALNRTTGLRPADYLAVLERMQSDALRANESLVMNTDFHVGSAAAMGAGRGFFADQQVPFVHATRVNVLDVIICKVRDCFGKVYTGEYPVCGGNRSSLCFARRASGDACPAGYTYKALLASETLAARLGALESQQLEDHKRLKEGGFLSFGSRRTLSYEMLASFQYSIEESGPALFYASVAEWHALLLAWGAAHTSFSHVARCLRGKIGSRLPPSPHASVIYNEADVRAVLCSPSMAPRFGRYIRPPCA